MNMNITTRNVEARSSFARRHKIITTLLAIPAFVMVLGITIALGVGFAGSYKAHHDQITIQRSDSAYQDCTTFAQARGFAVDVCEPLLTTSAASQASCINEIRYHEVRVDCPTTKP